MCDIATVATCHGLLFGNIGPVTGNKVPHKSLQPVCLRSSGVNVPSGPAITNGLAFLHLHLHHHRHPYPHPHRRRHHHYYYCFSYVYIPWSQVWNPCISDVRSMRDKNTIPRIIPFKIRTKQENNPTIMLKKKKKYDTMENKRLKGKK